MANQQTLDAAVDRYRDATKELYAAEQAVKLAQERYTKALADLNKSILGLP